MQLRCQYSASSSFFELQHNAESTALYCAKRLHANQICSGTRRKTCGCSPSHAPDVHPCPSMSPNFVPSRTDVTNHGALIVQGQRPAYEDRAAQKNRPILETFCTLPARTLLLLTCLEEATAYFPIPPICIRFLVSLWLPEMLSRLPLNNVSPFDERCSYIHDSHSRQVDHLATQSKSSIFRHEKFIDVSIELPKY